MTPEPRVRQVVAALVAYLTASVATWAQPVVSRFVPAAQAAEAAPAPAIGAPASAKEAPAEKPAQPSVQEFLIDLPTALQLADMKNPQVQFARERIRAAEAELRQAEVLWLPDLSVRSTWLRHDGKIQDTRGEVITVSRSALFAGGGVETRLHVADAIFAPLAARQLLTAQVAGAQATTNDILRDVALGYWELVRANVAVAIATEALANARKLDDLAQAYLKTQKLKQADAERARAELRGREHELEAARETAQVASIRLARLLRLDPFVILLPADQKALPVTLVDAKAPPGELAAIALGNRPDLEVQRSLVAAAAERLRHARYGPWIPSLVLDYRAGGFGGGPNSFFGDFDGRSDVEAGLVWQFHNLGLGDRALYRQRESELRQTQILETAELDRVVAEVAEALHRVRSRHLQMEAAQSAKTAATASYQLNWKLFTDGGIELIRPIEVLQSIQTLARAQQDYLSTLIEYNRAQALLYWALGNPVH